MSNIFFTVLIAIITLIATVITLSGDIISERKITKRGWFFIGLNVVLVLLSAFQTYNQGQEDKRKEDSAKIDRNKRDSSITENLNKTYQKSLFDMKTNYDASTLKMKNKFDTSNYIMKAKFDTSSQRLTKIVSTTLGKYGYKLDSVKNTLNPNQPVFNLFGDNAIEFIRKDKGEYIYKLNIASLDAGSSCFNIKLSYAIEDSILGAQYINNISPILYDSKFAAGVFTSVNISVPEYFRFSRLFLYFRGTYGNLDCSKKFTVNEVWYFNMNGKNVGTYYKDTKKNVIDFIHKHEKDDVL